MKWVLIRAGLLVAAAGFIYFGLTLEPKTKVVVGGPQYRPVSIYSDVVDKFTPAKNRTKLTFDGESITSALKSRFPEINSASIELPIVGRQAVVRINVSAPAINLISSKDRRYIVSASGRVVDEAAQLLNITGLPIVKEQAGLPIAAGSSVLSSRQVNFINVVTAQLKLASIKIKYFVLPASPQELDVYISGNPYFIKMYFGADPLQQAGSYLAAAKYIKTHHTQPTQYIDVRVSGKVFYR